MIVGIPGGATLAAVVLCWLGATAPAGRHVRPGRLARLARAAWELRNGLPVHDPGDWDDDDDPEYAQSGLEAWVTRAEEAISRWDGNIAETPPMEWRDALLRKKAPHLYGPDWYRNMRIEHIRWATMLWEEIRTMKREAGISE